MPMIDGHLLSVKGKQRNAFWVQIKIKIIFLLNLTDLVDLYTI